MTERAPTARRAGSASVLTIALLVLCGSLASTGAVAAAPERAPLHAPKTTKVEDAAFLTNVAKADSDLTTYVEAQGNVALRAMLTDGSAFCAFLQRDGSIDDALVDVADGARSVESQTHLPTSVHTFNTLESVALIDLCPGEQRLVSPSVRTELRRLGKALGSATVTEKPAG